MLYTEEHNCNHVTKKSSFNMSQHSYIDPLRMVKLRKSISVRSIYIEKHHSNCLFFSLENFLPTSIDHSLQLFSRLTFLVNEYHPDTKTHLICFTVFLFVFFL